ncbi:hypothetical protein SBA1_30068 [Candidatus Sulfotelmatobacter kueseliae]|uniref:Uncharacterized protein n=1 Tax=Candidatus Sulfotelmatobacter kueseliae TaxID=2042962 RepID=A0A2U3KKX0_9BACT|nr:hypothetical protein SBA1_30068 [Candidatus Sulfotelmatobacter kueseliae]
MSTAQDNPTFPAPAFSLSMTLKTISESQIGYDDCTSAHCVSVHYRIEIRCLSESPAKYRSRVRMGMPWSTQHWAVDP